jgi:divalent metal cation (Fe/Co/Zn/Cd) transporter
MRFTGHAGAMSDEATLATPGVLGAAPVRLRWVGRRLRAECSILVDPNSSVVEAHAVAVSAEHRLIHAIPRLAAALVHADPLDDADHHALLADHVALLATGASPQNPRPPAG